MKSIPTVVLALALFVVACATRPDAPEVAPPLPRASSAYEAAARIELEKPQPEEHSGLHNLFRLGDRIVSGSEPEGEEAMRQLSEMGVRTILSVDGKVPDARLAAKYGMKYVHVPIRYNGITQDEALAITKTFREGEGPFYVHCFHGQHRGPAAAALGRVVLDGVPRDLAIAEMRQWCGTAPQYEGLYESVAFGEIPTAAQSEAYPFDFAPAFRVKGFRQAMIEISRAWDVIEAQSTRDWERNPAHPDANARNEAEKLVDASAQAIALDEVRAKDVDFRGWIQDTHDDAARIAALLRRHEAGDPGAAAEAVAAVKDAKASCSACHKKYRN